MTQWTRRTAKVMLAIALTTLLGGCAHRRVPPPGTHLAQAQEARDFLGSLPWCPPEVTAPSVDAVMNKKWSHGECVLAQGQLVVVGERGPACGEDLGGGAGREGAGCNYSWKLWDFSRPVSTFVERGGPGGLSLTGGVGDCFKNTAGAGYMPDSTSLGRTNVDGSEGDGAWYRLPDTNGMGAAEAGRLPRPTVIVRAVVRGRSVPLKEGAELSSLGVTHICRLGSAAGRGVPPAAVEY